MFDRGEVNSFYGIGKIIETPSKHESEVLPLAKLEQRCYNILVEESLPVETGVQEGKVYS